MLQLDVRPPTWLNASRTVTVADGIFLRIYSAALRPESPPPMTITLLFVPLPYDFISFSVYYTNYTN